MSAVLQLFKNNPYFIGPVVGGFVGGICGVAEAHNKYKDHDIIPNLGFICCNGIVGFSVGYIFGYIWPVSLPVLLDRAYRRGRFDSSILFAIENPKENDE